MTKGIDTPIAKAIVENKMEEQRQQQVVADAQAKFLYNAGERGKDHIAIYLDDQTALHGNWNGTTEKAENSVIGQLDLGIPMQFIHVES